jgi:alcohol dehydrogenase class IV
MFRNARPFEFDHGGSEVVYGRRSIERLEDMLGDRGLERALVVCGQHVGANDDVMGPVRRGLGDRLVGVFDETTPAKDAATVFDGIEVVGDVAPDVLVGVGGGSSLDVARQMSAFAADGRSLSQFREGALAGRVESPDTTESQLPVIVAPTTFAGAGLSDGGSIQLLPASASPTGQPIRTSGSTTPTAVVYDPALFETTPAAPLARSAMNGFDKAVETLYASTATPVSDATAIHALRHLTAGFPALDGGDPSAMERAVLGLLLAQLDRQVSIVHAFGHAFAARYPLQQGVVHAVMIPHVLRYVLEETDGYEELLAEGLGVEPTSHDSANRSRAVVSAVVEVRDSFDLPTRLRSIDVVERADFPALAAFVVDDRCMARAPDELAPTPDDLESVLERAW